MPLRLTCYLIAVAIVVPALGEPTVLTTGTALDVRVQGDEAVLQTPAGPLVRGTITVSPHPIRPVCDRVAFVVDEQVRLVTEARRPEFRLDTTSLDDGEHTLRIEAERDGRLVMSTGTIRLRVGNQSGSAVMGEYLQVPEMASPPFTKLYRAAVSHDAVWFAGQEADLERHSFVARDRIYLTLTDLVRHVGGQLVWGPSSRYIELRRNDVTLQLTPGTRKARVNNNVVDLGSPVLVRGGRTYVPARAVCDLLGVYIEWNKQERRAYIYAPQPSYAVDRREYPWISRVTNEPITAAPGRLTFHNHNGVPVHVRFQGNGFMADWQIRAMSTLGPVYIAAGTYRVTVWSRQGADYETYITVAAGVDDRYDISVHEITLQSH